MIFVEKETCSWIGNETYSWNWNVTCYSKEIAMIVSCDEEKMRNFRKMKTVMISFDAF
jgi:hypothetical protein